MPLYNRLSGIYQQVSQTLRYKNSSIVIYLCKHIRFNGKIDIGGLSKLFAVSGDVVLKGFAELGEFALLNAYNGCIEVGINMQIVS